MGQSEEFEFAGDRADCEFTATRREFVTDHPRQSDKGCARLSGSQITTCRRLMPYSP